MRDHIGVPCEPATLQRGPRSFRLEYDPQKEEDHLMTKTMLSVMMALAVMPWSNSFGQGPMTDASNIQLQIPLPNFAVFGTESVTINDGLNENTRCVKGNVGGTICGNDAGEHLKRGLSQSTAPLLKLAELPRGDWRP
jgi:hypothetical protein